MRIFVAVKTRLVFDIFLFSILMNKITYKVQESKGLKFPSRVHRLVKSDFSGKQTSNNYVLEAAVPRLSTKYLFSEIPQILNKTTVVESRF